MTQRAAISMDEVGFRLMARVLAGRGVSTSWIILLRLNNGVKTMCQVMKKFKAYAMSIMAGEPKENLLVGFRVVFRYGVRVPILAQDLFAQLIKAIRNDNPRMIRLIMTALSLGGWVIGMKHQDAVKILVSLTQQPRVEIPKARELQKSMSRFLESTGIGVINLPRYAQKLEGLPRLTMSSCAIYPGVNGSILEAYTQAELLKQPWGPNTYFNGNLVPLFKDGGMKLRLVGVCNPFVSQRLEPLKEFLFTCLAKIKEDSTFQTEEARKWLCQRTITGRSILHSVDETDWTYNFPQEIQRLMLSALGVPPEFATTLLDGYWGTVLDVGNSQFLTTIRKGQVMGLGPSWPLAALCHHWVIYWIKDQLKVRGSDDYRILGDDIVLTNDAVALRYKEIMRDWKVPISEAKTFVSKEFGEFAGRAYLKGMEIHPLRFKGDWQTFDANKWEMALVLGKRPFFKIVSYMLRSPRRSLRNIALRTVLGWSAPRVVGGLESEIPKGVIRRAAQRRMVINLLLSYSRSIKPISLGTNNPIPSIRVRNLRRTLKLTQDNWHLSWAKLYEDMLYPGKDCPLVCLPWNRSIATEVGERLDTPPLELGMPEWFRRIPSPAKVVDQLHFEWIGHPQPEKLFERASLRRPRTSEDLRTLLDKCRNMNSVNSFREYRVLPLSEHLKRLIRLGLEHGPTVQRLIDGI